jgi:transposase
MSQKQTFRQYAPDQLLLLPPDIREWLPEDHLVWFVRDVVAELDLRAILATYDGSRGGQPAYDPTMMTALLVYGYCVGMASSRKIERATYESVPFRVLAADQHPDHDTIAAFRRRHLAALGGLFVQVLQMCRRAGLVKLGRVALDGTKMKANASRHKAMSYGRMDGEIERLEREVAQLLTEAEATDAAEDALYGNGKRGDELPAELKRRTDRIAKIRKAKAEIEAEARAKAEAEQAEYEKKVKAREARGGAGQPPRKPDPTPEAKAQRNFTDGDSRIMPISTGGFQQCYNCQAAVDETAQVIVAAETTQSPNDMNELEPMVEAIEKNLDGKKPKKLLADAGYYSEEHVKFLEARGIDPYLATGRLKHGEKELAPRGRIPKNAGAKWRMARKLRTAKGRATYAARKKIVEPVFGQIKQARGLRDLLLRGYEKVREEWRLICAAHNLLKLAGARWSPALG